MPFFGLSTERDSSRTETHFLSLSFSARIWLTDPKRVLKRVAFSYLSILDRVTDHGNLTLIQNFFRSTISPMTEITSEKFSSCYHPLFRLDRARAYPNKNHFDVRFDKALLSSIRAGILASWIASWVAKAAARKEETRIVRESRTAAESIICWKRKRDRERERESEIEWRLAFRSAIVLELLLSDTRCSKHSR